MKKTRSKLTILTAVTVAIVAILFFSIDNFGNPGGSNWKVPGVAKKLKNPVPSSKLSIKLGEKLFVQNCATCHGESGVGDGPVGKFLGKKVADLTSKTVQSQVDGVIFYKLTKGRAPMPSYKTILNTKQRWSVINYIRTLKSN